MDNGDGTVTLYADAEFEPVSQVCECCGQHLAPTDKRRDTVSENVNRRGPAWLGAPDPSRKDMLAHATEVVEARDRGEAANREAQQADEAVFRTFQRQKP